MQTSESEAPSKFKCLGLDMQGKGEALCHTDLWEWNTI